MPYGILIRGGAVYDGSGGPAEFAMLRGQETQPPEEGQTTAGLYL